MTRPPPTLAAASTAELLRALDRADTFAALGAGAGLTLDDADRDDPPAARAGVAVGTGSRDPGLAAALEAPGFARLEGVLAPGEARALAEGVEALAAAGLPAAFVLVFDQAWRALARLEARLGAALGDVEAVADAWAFRVTPGRAGWAPHRGWPSRVVDAGGRAALFNAWLALTDARADTSCMWLVPKALDPDFPGDLGAPASPSLPPTAVPLETAAGDAAVWDASVLHAGGPSRADAAAARVSVSFTLRRPGAAPSLAALRPPRTFRARLDRLAADVRTYGRLDGLSPSLLGWADLTCALAAARAR